MHSAVDSALQPHPSPESTPSDAVGPRVQPQRLPSPAPVARAGLGKTPDWRRRPPDLAVRSPCVSALTAPSPRLVVAPHTIATLSRSSLAYRVSAIACCLVGVTLSGAHPALWGSRGPLAACQRFPPRPSVWSRSAPPPRFGVISPAGNCFGFRFVRWEPLGARTPCSAVRTVGRCSCLLLVFDVSVSQAPARQPPSSRCISAVEDLKKTIMQVE